MSVAALSVKPVTLTGPRIRLEPLSREHVPELFSAAGHDEIWAYLDEPTPQTLEAVDSLILEALEEREQGHRLPFAVVLPEVGKTIGSISYIDIQPQNRSLEIGWAWLAPAYWKEGIGREASLLLIHHAFERLGAVRIAFKTDARNDRSQGAIASLGAVREGVFRHHRILRDGLLRDSVFYSLIQDDWQAMRSDVMARIGLQP